MSRDQEIKAAVDRMVGIYKKRPEVAVSTAVTEGRLSDGTKCVIENGRHSLVMDVPEVMGGTDEGPTPGFYARAGIIGCVSLGVKMQAARAGIAIRSIAVRVETDFDDKAAYKLCEKTAAPLETRLEIAVDCDLPEHEISEFIEDVLTRDAWFLALKDAQNVKTAVKTAVQA